MNGEQVSSSHLLPLSSHPRRPPSLSAISQTDRPAVSASSKSSRHPTNRSPKSRRNSLPFSFPPLFSQPTNSSSPSLVPAEGRPIPLDDSTAAHRTSALRELNSNYPSSVNRHRYAKSTGAQSSTYSQPVIVRTYSGPSPSNAHSTGYPYRPSSATRGGSKRVPLTSRAGSYFSRGSAKPTAAGTLSLGTGPPSTGSRNGRVVVNNMPRATAKKSKLPWQWPLGAGQRDEEAKLPPLEAFSFKSFMEGLDSQEGETGGISADLDRIAEICARSRYSLSNQYEVHVAPHGSGGGFANVASSSSSTGRRRGGSRQGSTVGGPTLQAIGSDDEEHAGRTQRKRRSGARRKSVAYGTLETIMSSSRSSEEDKTKKKSAAEIAEEVRGRAVRKAPGAAGSASGVIQANGSGMPSRSQPSNTAGQRDPPQPQRISRKHSASFANTLMENKKQATGQKDGTSPRGSASALVSEPARPQTSPSHLEIRTAPDTSQAENHSYQAGLPESPHSEHVDVLADLISSAEEHDAHNDGVTGWSTWIPWKAPSSHGGRSSRRRGSNTASHAEGSLRQLLNTVEVKDKGKAASRHG